MTQEPTVVDLNTGEIAPSGNGASAVIEADAPLSVFGSNAGFVAAQRQANLLASSTMVPNDYQGNIPNCVIALEMAQRVGASVFAVMQSLVIVHGRPSWEAKFIIAALNSSGRFSPLRFELTGEKDQDSRTCYAWATDRSGKRLEGPEVSIQMAKAEGWYNRNGSKWKTMADVMLHYRAASFFGKLYAPDILVGMQTAEEVGDIIDVTPEPERTVATDAPIQTRAESVKNKLKDQQDSTDFHNTDAAIKDLQSAPDTAALDLLFEQHVHAVDPKDKPKLQKAYQGKRTELDKS